MAVAIYALGCYVLAGMLMWFIGSLFGGVVSVYLTGTARDMGDTPVWWGEPGPMLTFLALRWIAQLVIAYFIFKGNIR